MNSCIFCKLIERGGFFEDPSGLFIGIWDALPQTPGHALLVPKRHVARFRDMNEAEMSSIAKAAARLKDAIEQAKLADVYATMTPISDDSAARITAVQQLLKKHNGPPTAFNDAVNDGPDAGQVIQHVHWHVLPRWPNDDAKGVLTMIAEGKL